MDAKSHPAGDQAENELGFDWSTMRRFIEAYGRDPVNAHSSGLQNAVLGAVNGLRDAVYPVVFHFKLNNRSHSLSLHFKSPMHAPRRDEPILLTFLNDDDGKKYRVSSFADYTTHEYYDDRILQNIDKDGLILHVYLKPVTVQPLDDETDAAVLHAFAAAPTRGDDRPKAVAEASEDRKEAR